MSEWHVKKVKTYDCKNQRQRFEWNRVELFFKNNTKRGLAFEPDSLQDFGDNPSLSKASTSFYILKFDLGIVVLSIYEYPSCDEVHYLIMKSWSSLQTGAKWLIGRYDSSIESTFETKRIHHKRSNSCQGMPTNPWTTFSKLESIVWINKVN